MKKIMIAVLLISVLTVLFASCGGKVNGDSAGKVSDTMQSTLMEDTEESRDDLTASDTTDYGTTDNTDIPGSTDKKDENLSEQLSDAATDIGEKLDGSDTTAQ